MYFSFINSEAVTFFYSHRIVPIYIIIVIRHSSTHYTVTFNDLIYFYSRFMIMCYYFSTRGNFSTE